MNQKIRNLAIAVLDDGDGTNGVAYALLHDLCQETGNSDILDCVRSANDRYYISETAAAILRSKKPS